MLKLVPTQSQLATTMNSLEATRVLTVLDEALNGIRLLSYVSTSVLDASGGLSSILGEDVCDALARHTQVVMAASSAYDADGSAESRSTLSLLRVLKRSPHLEARLQSLQAERSPAMQQLLLYFEKLRSHSQRRLSTTVEEDASSREYYAGLKERRERADAERLQLEHKLKLARLERAKQLAAAQGAEEHVSSELEAVRTGAAQGQQAMDAEAAAARGAAFDTYNADATRLAAELAATRAELAALRSDAKAADAAALKARRRAEQACESTIGEYDDDLLQREKEYQQALAAYNELQAQMESYRQETAAMRQERAAYEEALAIAREARRKEEMRLLRREAAAYAIQNAWKVWRKKKEAERKAASKGKGDKGKKKK